MPPSNDSTEQRDHLIIHAPDGSVHKHPIPAEIGVELKVGRELDNDVVLSDPRTSRHHGKIRRVSDDLLEISDSGSANGTIVGTVLIDAGAWHQFSPGQVVQLGDTRIVWEQAVSSQSTVAMTPVSGPRVNPQQAQRRQKSGSMLPWVLGGLLAVFLIGLVAWLFFGINRPDETEIAVATTKAGDQADLSQQARPDAATPTSAAQSAADAATATPTPTIQLAPAQPRILIEKIRFLPVISGALFDPTHVYLIVKVRVENLGDEPFVVSPGLFRAETADGLVLEEFGQQFAASEFRRLGVTDRFEDLSLRSGGSVSEELVFFLETRPYELTLHFLPQGLTSLQVSLGTLAADQELAILLGTPTVQPTQILAEVDEGDSTATPTPEPTATLTPPARRADGFSRTVPQSALVGTIAFADFNGASYDLYFGDVASGEVSLWRNESSQPIFSHDGQRIAYHSWAEGSRGLITSNRDHSNGFLVATFLEDQLPSWSPDDSQILFLSRRTGTRQSQLYKAPANQERPQAQLILEGEYPIWGKNDTVVFKGWVTTGIGLRAASGTLTDYETLTEDDSDTAPSLSPDGKRVAFMSRRSGNWDIYLVNIDGSDLTQLTTDTADDGLPTWSPDGRAIAFVSNRGGPWAIWAMTPQGSGIRQLFTMKGSPDGFVASEPTTDTTRGWAEERISWTDN